MDSGIRIENATGVPNAHGFGFDDCDQFKKKH
jgi:hypothetical protein